jgi:hypothetical protein
MNTKIAILGLGPSLKNFDPADFKLSIGVNDIWEYVETDIVVCLDNRKAFNSERLSVIEHCNPIAFYSQMVTWDTKPSFRKIEIYPYYPETECNLDLPQFQKSYCSPFVAVQIAYRYYNATEIHLFGVDLVNHPHLDRPLCERIKIHFGNLKAALNQKGCDLVVHGEGILKDLR